MKRIIAETNSRRNDMAPDRPGRESNVVIPHTSGGLRNGMTLMISVRKVNKYLLIRLNII